MHTIALGRLSVFTMLTAASVLRTVSAQSPPSVTPATSSHLTVTYGTAAINPAGITVPAKEVANAPSLSFAGTNTSYVVIMMDFSVEATGSPDSNTTLLHWILPGFSSAGGTTTLTSHQNEIAPYGSPSPPPGQTHTYGLFLYSEPANFTVPADYVPYFNNLTASVLNRIGFNLTNFVGETGLGAPVAANWFLVSTANATVNSTVATNTTVNSTVATGTIQSSSATMIVGVESMLVSVSMLVLAVSLL